MTAERLFFIRLTRREKYSVKKDGAYYANYNHYRQEVREDCLGYCVYCDAHENELGGAESMCLDHFRPKVYDEFKHLLNEPNNLVWSCQKCNRAKWHHWPARGTDDTVYNDEGFIDPFLQDRAEYFEVQTDGKIVGYKPPAEYLIMLLLLNRPAATNRRKFRLQAFQLVPLLQKQIMMLEDKEKLSVEEQEKLYIFKQSLELMTAKLDFSLR